MNSIRLNTILYIMVLILGLSSCELARLVNPTIITKDNRANTEWRLVGYEFSTPPNVPEGYFNCNRMYFIDNETFTFSDKLGNSNRRFECNGTIYYYQLKGEKETPIRYITHDKDMLTYHIYNSSSSWARYKYRLIE